MVGSREIQFSNALGHQNVPAGSGHGNSRIAALLLFETELTAVNLLYESWKLQNCNVITLRDRAHRLISALRVTLQRISIDRKMLYES